MESQAHAHPISVRRRPVAALSAITLAILLMALPAACGPAVAPASAPTAPPATAPAATPLPAEEPAAAPATELPSGPRTYIIDPTASTASYIVEEEFFGLALSKYGIPAGLVDTVGSTQAIEGRFTLNWADLSASLGENSFTVDLSTLSSDQPLRDGWMRSDGPNFGRYPNAVFVATTLEDAPTTYETGDEVTFRMVGNLTIREITQPTVFVVTAALNDGTVTGVAEAQVTMSSFGISPPNFANTLTVADEFIIRVEFTAREE
jgi:polyisoprenoid-binding protein YceI